MYIFKNWQKRNYKKSEMNLKLLIIIIIVSSSGLYEEQL